MIELLRDRDLIKVSFYQSLLEAAGISTFIRNENVSNTEPSIPMFFPALCILNHTDQDAAVGLIQAHLEDMRKSVHQEMICPACGEPSPGNFDDCWNCGATLCGVSPSREP